AEKAAVTVSKDEDLVFCELAARPCGHFFNIRDHPFRCETRRDLDRVCEEVRLAGCALVPLDDGEIFLPSPRKPPAHRDRNVTRPAVDVYKDRISSIGATDQPPLIDSAYAYLLEPL